MSASRVSIQGGHLSWFLQVSHPSLPMNALAKAVLIPASAFTFCAVSCTTVGKMGQNSAAFIRKSSANAASKFSDLADTVRPPQVKIATVRDKDLRKMPTGRERALAYENSRKRSWLFGGPVDFKEPPLPVGSSEADGSLLPSLTP